MFWSFICGRDTLQVIFKDASNNVHLTLCESPVKSTIVCRGEEQTLSLATNAIHHCNCSTRITITAQGACRSLCNCQPIKCLHRFKTMMQIEIVWQTLGVMKAMQCKTSEKINMYAQKYCRLVSWPPLRRLLLALGTRAYAESSPVTTDNASCFQWRI